MIQRRILIALLAGLPALVGTVGCNDSGTASSPSTAPAPAPPPPPTPAIVIRIDTEELTVGQTAALTATLSDGREQKIEGVWQSSDPEIGLIETTPEGAVLLKAVRAGSVAITFTSDGQRATLRVTILPILDIGGTLFVDPDILTPEDPSTFLKATYTGRGERTMNDRRPADWVTRNAFLFEATYSDGFRIEIQVNPEFETSSQAQREADKYGHLIGQLPKALRGPEFQTVWIHRGVELFGGGNNNVLIHTGMAEGEYESDGILEEALIHEAGHTSLDSTHSASPGWLDAQRNDMDFISEYARDHPTREDMAETFPVWIALRYREHRISDRLATTIRSRIPHRLEYLDEQNFDVSPVR